MLLESLSEDNAAVICLEVVDLNFFGAHQLHEDTFIISVLSGMFIPNWAHHDQVLACLHDIVLIDNRRGEFVTSRTA